MAAPASTSALVRHGMRRHGVDGFIAAMLALSSFPLDVFTRLFPAMWPVVRESLAGASPPIRGQIRWVAGLWCGLVLLQMWDSRNAAGVAGVAEFLSAILGATGVAVLGTAHTLQRTMEEAESRPRPREAVAAVQQVLLALPALGFASGVALGAAAVLMVLRALLGTELVLTVSAFAVYSAMLVFAGHTVTNSARTLVPLKALHIGAMVLRDVHLLRVPAGEVDAPFGIAAGLTLVRRGQISLVQRVPI